MTATSTEPAPEPDTAPAALPPVEGAPTWRRQPYRLFFPLGFLHLWAGLSPWLLTALGMQGHNTKIYHSIAQIQGFMLCFALGFLFTMIPRRTRTEAPGRWEMMICLLCPVAITGFAAFDLPGASQTFWFVLVATLVRFILRRFRRAQPGHGPLPSFVWLPIGILMGVTGSVLFGVFGALGGAKSVLGDEMFRIHQLAELFLLQGMFLSLVVGVGSMVFPLFTRGEAPAEHPAPRRARAVHLVAFLLLVGSFFEQVYGSFQRGHLYRAAICAGLLLWSGRIHRPPSLPGANRILVWLAAWMIPIGYLVAGRVAREQVQAGLHLVFVGGFATMAFAVAAHVSLAHGGRKHVLDGWPWQIVGYGLTFAVAVVARVRMTFEPDPDRYMLWLGTAAGSFLLGTLLWAWLVVPCLMPPRGATAPAK